MVGGDLGNPAVVALQGALECQLLVRHAAIRLLRYLYGV